MARTYQCFGDKNNWIKYVQESGYLLNITIHITYSTKHLTIIIFLEDVLVFTSTLANRNFND